jgi:hypothetical protein
MIVDTKFGLTDLVDWIHTLIIFIQWKTNNMCQLQVSLELNQLT